MAATYVEIVSIPAFESAAKRLLTEEDRRQLELLLVSNPEAGTLIKRTGGFRKLRFARPSRGEGKRGGTRVVYYLLTRKERIYLVLAYSKNVTDDLTPAQENELLALGRMLEGEE